MPIVAASSSTFALHALHNERLQAAIERVARILGQDLTSQNPILNTRLPDGSRVAVVGSPSSINGPTFTVRKFNRWFTSDELIASGSLPEQVRDAVVGFIARAQERHYQRRNGIGEDDSDESACSTIFRCMNGSL